MAIQVYSLSKEGYKQLTPNFRVREFRCRDGSDPIFVDDALVSILQKIREHFGKPLTITSGYRTPAHNKACGGAAYSQHLYGRAADFKIAGVGPDTVARLCRAAAARPGRHRGVPAQDGQGRRLGTHRHPGQQEPVEGVSEHGKLSDF